MQVTISNFRGLADLRATVAPVLLLAGSNGAGKSSACTAIGAAACGWSLPFSGITQKSAHLLVRDGADLAAVTLEDQGGSASVVWPASERTTSGRWADISEIAAGLADITSVPASARAEVLIKLIGAEPSADDLAEKLKSAALPQPVIDEALKQLPKGWDAAHEFFKTGGAKLKGKWEQVSGTRYGSAKAAGWRPEGWMPTMEALTVEDCADAIAKAENAAQEAAQAQGATQAQIDAWQVEADQFGERKNAVTAAKADHEKQLEAERKAKAAIEALGPRPQTQAEPLVCPCCQAAVQIVGGALVAAEAVDQEGLAQNIAWWDKVADEAKKATERAVLAQRYLDAATAKLNASRAANDALIAAKDRPASNLQELESAKADFAKAKTTADMRRRVNEATEIAEKIVHTATVAEVLDKTGLRQEKLVDALGAFNGRLVEVCKVAKWKPVHIDANMGISYNGRPISLCSAGEQYRARVTLQLAIARAEKANLVVIDGADILDRAGRNGLFNALKAHPFLSVIGMTILKREEMPDLSKAGIGKSIWIEGGHAIENAKAAA